MSEQSEAKPFFRTKDKMPHVGQECIIVRSTGAEECATYTGPKGAAHWTIDNGTPYWGIVDFWRPLES